MNAKAQIQKRGAVGTSQILSERSIRLADEPQIDAELIDSHQSGIGEAAATVVAPAVANAIYNAVGARVRRMPITAEAVLTTMKKRA